VRNDNPLGLEERYGGFITGDYLEAMREFVNRIDSLAETLGAERRESGLPLQMLTDADCIPNSQNVDLDGKLVIVKPEILAPEYRSLQHQIAVVTGGFGASAKARGKAVFVKELFSGKKCRYERHQIAGIADLSKLPECALAKYKELSSEEKPKTPETPQEKAAVNDNPGDKQKKCNEQEEN